MVNTGLASPQNLLNQSLFCNFFLSQRFGPPRPKGPLNDGRDAFDASYLNYITDWWDHVCPQVLFSNLDFYILMISTFFV